jgi:hypothetical protein
VCQKARIIVHDPERATTVAPSESSAGRKTVLSGKNFVPTGKIDVMQMQKILEKNPELSDVVSC